MKLSKEEYESLLKQTEIKIKEIEKKGVIVLHERDKSKGVNWVLSKLNKERDLWKSRLEEK